MWVLVNKYLNIVFFTLCLGFDGGLRNSSSIGQMHEESHHIHLHLITPSSDHLLSSLDLPNLSRTPHHLQPKDCLQEHQHYKKQTWSICAKRETSEKTIGDLFFLNYLFILVIPSRSTRTTPFVHFCSTIEWPPHSQIFHTSSLISAHAHIKRI